MVGKGWWLQGELLAPYNLSARWSSQDFGLQNLTPSTCAYRVEKLHVLHQAGGKVNLRSELRGLVFACSGRSGSERERERVRDELQGGEDDPMHGPWRTHAPRATPSPARTGPRSAKPPFVSFRQSP